MKKLILIALIALFSVSFAFAENPIPAAKTSTSSTVDMILNMTKIPTRVNVGFSSHPALPADMSLASVPNTITLLDYPVNVTEDHAELATSVNFYIWYYVSTTNTTVNLDFTFEKFSNGAQDPHYIGYTMTVEPYTNDGENDYYDGLIPTTPANNVVQYPHTDGDASKTIKLFNAQAFNSINKGNFKATVAVANSDYDSSKLTNMQYHSALTLTISAI